MALFEKLEVEVKKTNNIRILKDYYETRARTYFQLPWPFVKYTDTIESFRKASIYITKYLEKYKWLPNEELGIFYLEMALTEFNDGNILKSKVAAKKARKYDLPLLQNEIAKKLEKGSF